MIVEERIYTLHPGKVPEYMRLYEQEGFKVQGPILGKLVGWYQTDFGPLNQIVHMWAYRLLRGAHPPPRRARRQQGLAGLRRQDPPPNQASGEQDPAAGAVVAEVRVPVQKRRKRAIGRRVNGTLRSQAIRRSAGREGGHRSGRCRRRTG